MAQITIYINNELESKVKQMAKAQNISISKLISKLLEKNLHDEWDREVKKLVGSWKDFPSLEEIRSKQGEDIKREVL